MKKLGISLALLTLLTACGGATNPSDDLDINSETAIEEEAKDSFLYQQFYLTRMEKSRSDEWVDFSYGFDLPANSITVKDADKSYGLDGEEILPEPQKLIEFERADDGSITFSFEELLYNEDEGSYTELKTVTFEKLSNSVYALEDGTQYQFSEKETE